jgi:hypothetical protein
MNKVRIAASLAASAALLAMMAGTAGAATGGNPASTVPAGCSFSQGVTTCTTTASTLGTPTVVTVPSSFKSTSGPSYELEYARNIPDCTPGAPVVTGWDTTATTPLSVTTTTTAHRGAPGSQGEELPTQSSAVPGPAIITTSTTQPASPGTVTLAGTAANAVFTGLTPNSPYGLGVRCLGHAVSFWTDGAGAATVNLDLSPFSGRRIQLEMFAQPNDWYGPSFAVTAPLTPVAP